MLGEVAAAPALADVVLAILALLVLLAGTIWRAYLKGIFSHIPIVGGYIADGIDAWFKVTEAALDTWLGELTRATGHLAYKMVSWVWGYFHSNVATHAGTRSAAIQGINVGAAAKAAAGYAASLAVNDSAAAQANAEAWAKANGQAISDALSNLIASDIAGVDNAIAAARADLSAAVSAALATAEGFAASGDNRLQAELNNLSDVISAGLATAAATAAADLAQAIATAEAAADAARQAAISAANTYANAETAGAVNTLNLGAADVVNPALSALLAGLAPIAHALPADIVQALGLDSVESTAGVTSIAGALAVLAPAIAATATETAECLVPNCSALKSLGGLFNDLEHLGLAGLLFALIAEAIADPEAAADQIVAVAGWTSDLAVTLVNDL